MKHPYGGLCLALTAVTSPMSLHAQEPTFTLTPSADHQQLGTTYVAVGDINGDGIADLAVSDPGYRADGLYNAGVVHLISGADGTTLRGYQGTIAQSQFFGLGLAALDVNHDGVLDLAVGAPGQSGPNGYGAGAVWIFSGADGAVLSVTTGPDGSQYGGSLENAGDQNGDGVDDLYVGASGVGGYYGAVFVQSGADGSTLRVINTTTSFANFGTVLATVGDVDGDGRADVAVSTPGFRVEGGNPVGKVSIIRSSDGGTAAEIIGTAVYHRLGESLASVPDINGDGLRDLMVGSYSSGGVTVVSGRDLTTLVDLSLTTLPAYTPVHVGGAVDYDKDGALDWLIGSTGLVESGSDRTGGIRVISGADGSALVEYSTTTPYTGLGSKPRVLPGVGVVAGENSLQDPETAGIGFAYVWRVIEETPELPPVDTDGDGVTDDIDAVPNSILTATVKVLGIDSTVKNTVDATGTSIADRYAKLGKVSDYKKPGLFLVNATLLSADLACKKVVTTKEAVKLTAAAAVATLVGSVRK